MIITAKFASVCRCCNARIEVGSKIEWVKGSKSRHVICKGVRTSTTHSVNGFVGTTGRVYGSALERFLAGEASDSSDVYDAV